MRRATYPLLMLLLMACAATIHDETRTQYVNPAFTAADLRTGGLALFPVTAGQGQEGYRRPLGDFLDDSLQVAVPGGRVLTWQATMDSLNSNDGVDAYEELVRAYAQTSIIHRDRAKELAGATKVRFALFCALQKASEVSKTSYSFWTGWSTTNTVDVVAHCLIIDLQSGDVMQEIVGQATSVGGSEYYNSPYEAYARVMARAVLSQLPGSAVSNVEPESPNKKTLHDR